MQNDEISKIKIVVLAAGKGTRMESELPKVLVSLNGKPMIKYLLESIKLSGLDANPVVVVGHKKELVIEELGPDYIFVDQKEMLGTGHAVKSVKDVLDKKTKNILVLYGDMPFITAETIQKIFSKHITSNKKMTMATVKVQDFKDWRLCFDSYGRIIRDKNGEVLKIVEKREATKDELKITEVNPSQFCFESEWLWQKLDELKNNNSKGEYYLTDLLAFATQENGINSVNIEPHEALGANTISELKVLERVEKER